MKKENKAQAAVFIIVAFVLVTGIVLYFLFFRGMTANVPKNLEPIYSYYQSCIEESAKQGSLILGENGGYITPPEFSAASSYMPFSNQLNFLGSGVPYWYYISANGVSKEQMPSLEKIEQELEDYIEEEIKKCDFSEFESQGYIIKLNEPVVKTNINERSIEINVENDLSINLDKETYRQTKHSINLPSDLGRFYSLAKKIYLNNKQTMFLENYALDELRLYAPVDGSEIGCSSKIWLIDEVRENLTQAVESNTPAIKIKGDYYELNKKENIYFVKDIGENVKNANINFMFSREWPMKLEVWPSEEGILKAEPVGLQEGLGILGFCYVPYHFVYDFAYPVMIQVYSQELLFQFPVVVYINKNKPKDPLNAESLLTPYSQLCEHKNTKITINTYDNKYQPIEAKINFKCFDTTCSIGQTSMNEKQAILEEYFPQCKNGYLIASKDGYKTRKAVISTIEPETFEVFLDKLYKLNITLKKDNALSGDYAIISFTKDNTTTTLSYPEQNEIELTEGEYTLKVYVYSNSSIFLPASSTKKCTEVPKSGFSALFGATEEKCYTVTIPSQTIDYSISAGGTQNYYFIESELEESKSLVINANAFDPVTKIQDLQNNYNNIELNGLDIMLEK
ncbi:MAG: hypothetical protein ACP5OG_05030 [Candidatus Nanoarchaeia archaeon]